MSFLHGVEVIELDGGARPIKGVSSSIIGLVGTASQGPVGKNVLVAGSRKRAIDLFGTPDGVSTIPDALDAIFDQTGAIVVVVNVANAATYLSSAATEDIILAEGKGEVAALQSAKAAGTAHIPINLVITLSDDSVVSPDDYLYNTVNQSITLTQDAVQSARQVQ